jgi:hypothetical protein
MSERLPAPGCLTLLTPSHGFTVTRVCGGTHVVHNEDKTIFSKSYKNENFVPLEYVQYLLDTNCMCANNLHLETAKYLINKTTAS